MATQVKRIAGSGTAIAAALLGAAAVYPRVAHARGSSHQRANPKQLAWIHRLDSILESGHGAMDKGDYATAEIRFQAAIAEEPNDRGLW